MRDSDDFPTLCEDSGVCTRTSGDANCAVGGGGSGFCLGMDYGVDKWEMGSWGRGREI